MNYLNSVKTSYILLIMKKSLFYYFATTLSLLFISNSVFAGTVSLDPTFNNTGYRIQSVDPDGEFGRSIGIQSDGKIVLGGWTLGAALYDRFAAMRLNSDGMLDTSFSGDGIVTTAYSNFNQVEKLLIQSNGRIILGGTRYFGQNDFAMIRYTTDGSLDTSFDGDGGAASPIDGNSEDFGKDMALQLDGKIVMVGSIAADSNAPTDIGIIRRNIDGSLDTSFNGTGILLIRFPNVNASADSVLIQGDGKIVIGGFVFTGIRNDLLLMRLNSNGFLDTSFGNNGLTITPVNASNSSVRTLSQQSDGKILAGSQNLFARYGSNGIIDNTFGNSGVINAPHSVEEIIVRNDNSFLVGGSSGSNIAVSRYLSNGIIDTTFNNTGTVTATVPGRQCFGSSIALQNDGRIIVGGNCTVSQLPTFAVFRLVETESPIAAKIFDFDGDRKTDVAIFRPNSGQWWYLRSSDNSNRVFQFGSSSDKIVPADYTGDGKTDIAVFKISSNEWFILRSEDSSFYSFPFGAAGDVPVAADFDGDGKADAAVFRPSNATWYILNSSGGTRIQQFGTNGDLPVANDFDGDGRTDLAIFRPSNGQWWINRSSNQTTNVYNFGTNTDKLVPADYTGDGKTDVAFWRPSSGEWFILRSENASFYSFPFGQTGDIPAPGDYDGDGKADAAIFRDSNTTWYLNQSTSGFAAVGFGLSGDRPVPSAFVP